MMLLQLDLLLFVRFRCAFVEIFNVIMLVIQSLFNLNLCLLLPGTDDDHVVEINFPVLKIKTK